MGWWLTSGERLQEIKARSRWRSGIRIGSRTTSASSSRFAILLIMSRYPFCVLRAGHRLRSSPPRAGEAQTLSISTPCQNRGEAKQEARTVLAGIQSQSPCDLFWRGAKYSEFSKFVCDMKTGWKFVFAQVQRRGPTAFRRLLASLYFSGHAEALKVLTKVLIQRTGIKNMKTSFSRTRTLLSSTPAWWPTAASLPSMRTQGARWRASTSRTPLCSQATSSSSLRPFFGQGTTWPTAWPLGLAGWRSSSTMRTLRLCHQGGDPT